MIIVRNNVLKVRMFIIIGILAGNSAKFDPDTR